MKFKKIETDIEMPEEEIVKYERMLNTLYSSYSKIYLKQIENQINRMKISREDKNSLIGKACEQMNSFKASILAMSVQEKSDLAVKNSAFELNTKNIKQAEIYLLEHYSPCPINALQSKLLADKNENPVHKLAISLVETASRFKNKFDKENSIYKSLTTTKLKEPIKTKMKI
ncbi:TPA: hypothetical protein N0H21_001315 [Pseudomonas aeruginosa]|nr:hypothetical protein [Pseudomonas aeruginosa]